MRSFADLPDATRLQLRSVIHAAGWCDATDNLDVADTAEQRGSQGYAG